MNEMTAVRDSQKPAMTAPNGAEATLASFLDTADRLYERIGAALGRVGLSYPKYELLEHLKNSVEPVSLGALADGQSCARSNITQLVDKLEIEGLVRRVADPDDRRGIRAELTEAGAERVSEGRTQLDVVIAEFAASFTAKERLELGRLLDKVK
jgi:DNA-binding MarR family transcriptional regulator